MLLMATIHGDALSQKAPVINEVLATQVALDRSGFSPGEIDGRAGRNLQRALAAFQGSHQLPATGQLDDQTWKQLAAAGGDVAPLVDCNMLCSNCAIFTAMLLSPPADQPPVATADDVAAYMAIPS